MNYFKDYIFYLINKILKRNNDGLIETSIKEIEREGDFILEPDRLGFVSHLIKKDDSDWREFEPAGQQQNEGEEKMHCVSESATNTIETTINYYLSLIDNGKASQEIKDIIEVFAHFGLIKNGKCRTSPRFIAKGAGTTRRGANQRAVADFIRHGGLVPYEYYPMVRTWREYYQDMPAELKKQGKKLVDFIDISHEWVHPNNFKKMNRKGSLQTSGFAWDNPVNSIFARTAKRKNHAFQESFVNTNWVDCLDSYKPFNKKLAHNYNFGYGKLFTIRLKKKLNIFNEEEIKKLKNKGWNYILLVNQYKDYDPGVYELLDDKLKKKEIKGILDAWVTTKAKENKLEGINKQSFAKLFN